MNLNDREYNDHVRRLNAIYKSQTKSVSNKFKLGELHENTRKMKKGNFKKAQLGKYKSSREHWDPVILSLKASFASIWRFFGFFVGLFFCVFLDCLAD